MKNILLSVLLISSTSYADETVDTDINEAVDTVINSANETIEKITQQYVEVFDDIAKGKAERWSNCVKRNTEEYCDYTIWEKNVGVYTGYGDKNLNEFTSMYIKTFRLFCSTDAPFSSTTYIQAANKNINIDNCKEFWRSVVYRTGFDYKRIYETYKLERYSQLLP